MKSQTIGGRAFEQSGGTQDWRVLATRGVAAWFAAPDTKHASGAALARSIVELAAGRRRPDLDLRAGGIQVWIPDDPALTVADVELARDISAAAADLGLVARPWVPQSVEIAVDTTDRSGVAPFWQTMLGYQDTDDLLDPLRRDPRLWFQQTSEHRPLRNRIHLDVSVPQDQVVARLDALRAAGSQVSVADGAYHSLVTDADGNEVDLLPVRPGDDRMDGSGLEDWRIVFEAAAFYPTTELSAAVEVAASSADIVDRSGVPLSIDVRAGGVRIGSGKDLWEDDRFPEVARQVQQAARAAGLAADPDQLRFVQIGFDAVDVPAVREFWRVTLGYLEDPRPYVTDVNHPYRLGPDVFVSQMEATDDARRAQRNRIHLDLFVPVDQVEARVQRALAAGGRVVRDEHAPRCWTVADPEGNEIDIAVA